MADACREWRGELAAAALGRLDPVEEIALRAHLDGCADCRRELAALEGAAAVLPLADATRIGGDAAFGEPPPDLEPRVRARVERERSARRRRHRTQALAVLVTAAAVFVAVVFVTVGLWGGDNGGREVVFADTNGVAATAVLHERRGGTEVELAGSGFDRGDVYWLWLTGADGHRVGAGTFEGADGEIDVTMTAAIPSDAARRIWVTDAEDHVVLDARLPS